MHYCVQLMSTSCLGGFPFGFFFWSGWGFFSVFGVLRGFLCCFVGVLLRVVACWFGVGFVGFVFFFN